jgi:predicted nucleic acid-binding protein
MPAVSNTSPILNLAVINRLSLLQDQFGEIHIPPAVLEEFKLAEEIPGNPVIRGALEAGWLKVVPMENSTLVRSLERELDRGEAEAIALALQLNFSRILMDEQEGRETARTFSLEPVGVAGILLRAKHERKIALLSSEITELPNRAGFYLSEAFVREILRAAGE